MFNWLFRKKDRLTECTYEKVEAPSIDLLQRDASKIMTRKFNESTLRQDSVDFYKYRIHFMKRFHDLIFIIESEGKCFYRNSTIITKNDWENEVIEEDNTEVYSEFLAYLKDHIDHFNRIEKLKHQGMLLNITQE